MPQVVHRVLSDLPVTFFVLGLIATLVVLVRRRTVRPSAVTEALLSTFLLFSVGLSYLYNFVMHVCFGASTARFIGWTDNLLQAEIGYASLGFAMVGFFAARQSAGAGARAAAILGPSLFVLGAAAGHARQMIGAHIFAPGNAGAMFWTDVLFPVVGGLLLAARYGVRGGRRAALAH